MPGLLSGKAKPKTFRANVGGFTGLKVFPSPADNRINLQFQCLGNGAMHMEIYDLPGQLHSSTTVTVEEGMNIISKDVSNLVPAQYVARLRNEKLSKEINFIINR